ncbi:MAG: hypothetical protein Q8O88_03270 [bacterium]|nr:hypothetical protein [bacterium]
MEKRDPFRDESRVKFYTKIFRIEGPLQYVQNHMEAVKFVNRLLGLGVKREDIKFFENSLIYYVDGQKHNTLFFTILYYAKASVA